MDFFTKFNEQTTERDRAFRLIQYTAKLVASVTQESSTKDGCLFVRCKSVERTISLCRQMLRFGQFTRSLKAALACISMDNPSMINTFVVLSNISDAMYVLTDNLVFLSRCGAFDIDEERISNLSDSYWLYSVILLLMKNICQAQLIYQNTPNTTHENSIQVQTKICNFVVQNKILSFDILRNLCDICICMSSLQKANIPPTFVGLAGVVGSLIPFLKSRYVHYN